MKRLGKVWNEMLEPDNGFVAIVEGTMKKRKDRVVQKFLFSDEYVAENPTAYHQIDPKKAEDIKVLAEELRSGKWKHGEPHYKRIYSKNKTAAGKGKWRDIYVPSFRDHIVHHMLMQVCMPAFRRGMHPYCCGSVPGRGTKAVIKNCVRWFQNDKECRYFVKLDIRHFFDSIQPDILMDVLSRKIKDKMALRVFDQIVHSAPSACPIGYYPSPWLANLYLQDFDWFVEQKLYKERRGKRIKYVRHYIRFIDDILLIGTSKTDLHKAVKAMKKYLCDIGLSIKSTWEIKRIGEHQLINGQWRMKPGTYWCDFIGYKFCKDSIIMRDGIFLSAKRLAKKMSRTEHYTLWQCQSINARIGWAKHCDSFGFMAKDIRPYIDLKTTRRIISDVDKKRKQRINEACRFRANRQRNDRSPQFS